MSSHGSAPGKRTEARPRQGARATYDVPARAGAVTHRAATLVPRGVGCGRLLRLARAWVCACAPLRLPRSGVLAATRSSPLCCNPSVLSLPGTCYRFIGILAVASLAGGGHVPSRAAVEPRIPVRRRPSFSGRHGPVIALCEAAAATPCVRVVEAEHCSPELSAIGERLRLTLCRIAVRFAPEPHPLDEQDTHDQRPHHRRGRSSGHARSSNGRPRDPRERPLNAHPPRPPSPPGRAASPYLRCRRPASPRSRLHHPRPLRRASEAHADDPGAECRGSERQQVGD